MKNKVTTTSPYILLLVPVIIFIGLSFGIKKEIAKLSSQHKGYGISAKTEIIFKECPNRFFQFLIKNNN